MENGLVTADGTKVLTVEEYERFINAIPEAFWCIVRHPKKSLNISFYDFKIATF